MTSSTAPRRWSLADAVAAGGRPCEDCASLPDVLDCPVCGAPAYLVHDGRPWGRHWHACALCRRAEATALDDHPDDPGH